ncbi:hypothetical protein M9980_09415 [Sphingomonas donggukensis]|uniref:Transmembrane protein n=1 Tax=Sphingomonas donggukensis TaxID=2949093 RepID=A0ABY4TSV5_9SPHN|nr:hypothetical protein [Sphingomonas donggukensis]URW74791.1 hypothetical protein M9980_09415 [Sphingomonas donggukensis]
MARVALGGILGGIAMWLIGFLFWGTPLSRIALSSLDDASGAALQGALKQHLSAGGAGAYPVPWPGTDVGTTLYGQGPSAMVFYHPGGLPVVDSSALIGGLVLAVVCSLLIGIALYALRERVTTFADRMKVVVWFVLAATLWTEIGQPVFNHMPWTYFVYLWVSDVVALVAAGAVIARWFLPRVLEA